MASGGLCRAKGMKRQSQMERVSGSDPDSGIRIPDSGWRSCCLGKVIRMPALRPPGRRYALLDVFVSCPLLYISDSIISADFTGVTDTVRIFYTMESGVRIAD